jgi:hypothetical protein
MWSIRNFKVISDMFQAAGTCINGIYEQEQITKIRNVYL